LEQEVGGKRGPVDGDNWRQQMAFRGQCVVPVDLRTVRGKPKGTLFCRPLAAAAQAPARCPVQDIVAPKLRLNKAKNIANSQTHFSAPLGVQNR